MALHVFVFLLVVCLLLSLARLGRLCWFHLRPSSSRGRGQAHHAPPSAQAPLPRRLPRLSSRLHSLVGWRACACASLARGEKPARSTQAHEHRGLRLSQPAVPLLRDHRCSHPRAGRRWQAWPGRAHPDVSLSGLPHHVHCPTPYPLVPSENPFPPGRHGAVGAGRRAGSFRRRTGLRLPASDHHHLAHSRRRARTDLARALLPQPPAPPPAIGRTAHQAALLYNRCCGSGWPSIPCTKILPVLHLGPRTQYMAHRLSTPCDRSWLLAASRSSPVMA